VVISRPRQRCRLNRYDHAVEQIVGRERRERVLHHNWSGEGALIRAAASTLAFDGFLTPMQLRKSIVIFSVAVLLIGAHAATAQTKKRLVPLPEWSLDNTDDEVSLELVGINLAGKPIALDKPFDADENWLKNMTLRVKNVGTKPIVAFGVGGGLLRGVTEELPDHASFEYGVGWNWGKNFNPDKEKHHGPVLNVGDTIELSYADVDALTRRVLAKEGEGAFCKLKFMGPAIQYADGSSAGITARMRFRKTP
jgi:hypothetical protein